MRLRTNVQSLVAQRFVTDHSESVEGTQRNISSGKRLNRAGDDAASLSISTKLNSNIRSKNQALRNANDAISYVQVAEGAISEISNLVVRMRELSIQAATATISNDQRHMLDMEMHQLRKEVDRISGSAELGGKKLLSGKQKKFEVQVDSGSGGTSKITMDMSELAQDTHALGIFDVNVSSRLQARYSLAKIDHAINSLSESQALLGSYQSRFQTTTQNLGVSSQNLQEANSQLSDTDIAKETAKKISSDTKLKTAMSAVKISHENAASYLKLFD